MKQVSITKLFEKMPAVKQAAVAKLARISPQHLHAMKTGVKEPTEVVRQRINAALDTVEKQVSSYRI